MSSTVEEQAASEYRIGTPRCASKLLLKSVVCFDVGSVLSKSESILVTPRHI